MEYDNGTVECEWGSWNVIMGPWNMNREMWNVIMGPHNVDRGAFNVIVTMQCDYGTA